MKKILSIALCLVFALGCMVLPVSAQTASPEVLGTVTTVEATQPDGTSVTVKWETLKEQPAELAPQEEDDTLIAMCSLDLDENAVYPIRLKARIAGVKANSNVYVLAKTADGVAKVSAKVESDGVVTFELKKEATAVSFVKVDSKATTSPATGNSINLVGLAMIVALATVFGTVSFKKKVQE